MAGSKYTDRQSVGNGQTILTPHGRDDSNYMAKNSKSSMGGGIANLSHSISGASAKMDGNASKQKKDRFS